MTFTATCVPGRNRAEWPHFLGFLRELRDSLDNMADILDPQAESEYYRHFVVVSDLSDQERAPQ